MKRALDVSLSALFLILLSPVIGVTALLVRAKLGSPVIFKQPRPGVVDPRNGKERIFLLYKFRSMNDACDASGEPLSDAERMTPFGRALRASSLDELPELVNVLCGEMSLVGPRPQLVRDMTFMSDDYRRRHWVRPGLTGLAQIRGRNAISWDDKLSADLEYIENVSFFGDLGILFKTFGKVLGREGVESEGCVTSEDYGDYLLRTGRVTEQEYLEKLEMAKKILRENERHG